MYGDLYYKMALPTLGFPNIIKGSISIKFYLNPVLVTRVCYGIIIPIIVML